MGTSRHLKRAACLIASQLPDDEGEAMRVLDYARGIVSHLKEERGGAQDGPSQLSQTDQRDQVVVQLDARASRIGFLSKANPE